MGAAEKNMWEKFNPTTKLEWLEKIRKDLKGRDIYELDSKISDSVISPFSHADDFSVQPKPTKTGKGNWSVGEIISITNDFKSSNKKLLRALIRGVQSPVLEFDVFPDANALEILLSNVELDYIALHFSVKSDTNNLELFLKNFYDYAQSVNKNPDKLNGSIRFEPFDRRLNDINLIVNALAFGKKYLPLFKIISINARPFFSDGENIVEELTQTLLACNSYFSELTVVGVSTQDIADRLIIICSIGKNYFMEIAKLRALRIVWQHLLSGYSELKLEKTPSPLDSKLMIEAVIQPQKTIGIPQKNIIGASTQIMSAVIGGADNICTEVENSLSQIEQDAFNQRILTNIQHLLSLESYFDRVVDPLAGSYYVETLTLKIAETVWENFKNTVK